MKYQCLRDCFVNSRLWREGQVYNLPDTMEKSPKNFKPVQVANEPEVPPAPEAPARDQPAPESPVEQTPIPEGQYWCGKCKTLHRENSGIGKRHLKHKVEGGA
jgi:hypothetical protein